ncbi:MAG: hypothetical protein K6G73_10255, partial [Marinilabiliaceae bacterium]|nr:hypothetical protein [Marinilabiliaceae bacterium]
FLSFGMSFPKSECKCRAFFVTRNTLLAKIFTHFCLFAVFLIITTVLTMVNDIRLCSHGRFSTIFEALH